jgi:hypothetical protein
MDKKVISADGHLDLFFLSPDTFTTRTASPLKDKVPQVVDLDGIPTWVGDGKVMGAYRGWMGRGGLTGYRGKRMMEAGWEPSHPADPTLRVKDLDIDGVAAEVIYGIRFIEDSIKDPEVITATYRAYNDFIAEFCTHNPKRLIGVANIPAHSVDGAVDDCAESARADWAYAARSLIGSTHRSRFGIRCGSRFGAPPRKPMSSSHFISAPATAPPPSGPTALTKSCRVQYLTFRC